MADKCVTIYTDSRYAFGVTHRLWALGSTNFLKSDGHPILNAALWLSFWRPFFYQTRSRSVNAQRTLTIKVLSPQETREQTRQRRPRQHRRQKKQRALVSVTNPDISPCLQSMQSFSTGGKNNDGGRLAAASRGVYG